ncbi:MAG: hypothetical protein MJZ86_04995 [Bacteroidales bacterium]|nr:hypothetical protein [Bacteroidales bacterium]
MKVILTGATGYVGEGVLLALLDDQRIEKVLSVGRHSCGVSHPKLEEYLLPDLMALQAGDTRLSGYDVVFFIAGITSVGTPKDVYKVISQDIPVHFAEIMPCKDQLSFIYLSGMGTTDKGRQYWQKVKSGTEQRIAGMGFRHAYGWRPCFMTPYKGQKSKQVKAQKAAKLFYPLFRLLGMACTMTEMVDAMYKACTEGYHKPTVEARDIIRLAK